MDLEANMYTSMEVEYDSDEDISEISNELSTWLAQLNVNGGYNKAGSTDLNAQASPLLTQSHTMESFRCSVIMDLDNDSSDLDDIIKDLCALEAKLSDAEKELRVKGSLSNGDSGNVYDLYSTMSQDTKVLPTSNSTSVAHAKLTKQSSNAALLKPTAEEKAPVVNNMGNRTLNNNKPVLSDNASDREQKIKEDKIKIAIQKIKDADIKKLFIKVFIQNGECKTILIDEKMTTHDVILTLFDKCEVKPNVRWTLIEQIPDLYLERIMEDHEKPIQVMMNWLKISNNKILFLETDDKYDLFFQPQKYLLPRDKAEKCTEKERRALLDELFGGAGTQVPELESELHYKVEGQKVWKKMTAVLRSSGIYSKKGKTSKGLQCMAQLDLVEIYRGFGWRKKFKAPSEHCFALKHPKLQKKSKDIKYFCCDDEYTLKKWLMGMRIAKYGKELHNGFRQMLDVASGKRKPSTGALDTPSDSMSQSSRDSGFSLTSDSSNSLDLSSSKKRNKDETIMAPPEQFTDLPPPPPELLAEEPTPTNTPIHFAHSMEDCRQVNNWSRSTDDDTNSQSSTSHSSSSVLGSTPRNSITSFSSSFDRCSSIRKSLRTCQIQSPPKPVHPPTIPQKTLVSQPPQPKDSDSNKQNGHYSCQFTQPPYAASSLPLTVSPKPKGQFINELKNIYAKKGGSNQNTGSDSDVDDLPPPPPELLSPDISETENLYDVPINQHNTNGVYNDVYSIPPPIEYNPYHAGYLVNNHYGQTGPVTSESYSMGRVFASQTGTIKRAPPPPKRKHSTVLSADHR